MYAEVLHAVNYTEYLLQPPAVILRGQTLIASLMS